MTISNSVSMEKVCVYQDVESIRKSINWCETVAKNLQELADDFSNAHIIPTIGKLQSLYNGSGLWDLISEACVAQKISTYPKRLQELMREDSAKDLDSIKTKAANLIHTDVAPIEWELYQVNNGKVIIRYEYKQIITDRNSIYIDTEARSAVYEKWLVMEKAIKEFNQTVSEAPKDNSLFETMEKAGLPQAAKFDRRCMGGLSLPDHFSLAIIDANGTPTLKGQNFEYIK